MSVPFGKEFKKKYFSNQDAEFINVNHGAMGVTPDPVLEVYCENFKSSQSNFDKYLRFDQRNEYIEALKALSVSDLLDCDYKSLAIVDSATAGVNTVLRSYPFKAGDKVIYTTTTYGACKNIVKFIAKRIGIVPVEVNLQYPLTQKEIVEKFEQVFKTEGPIKMALFDTVSSMPGAKLPYEEITQLCRQNDCLSLIDGAHGIGLVPELSLSKLKPDFFVSNLHKWLSTPKSCSVFYVDPKYQNIIHPLSVSHSYLDDDFEPETKELKDMRFIDTFWFAGSLNKASIASIIPAIQFRNEICGGEKAIQKYANDLAWESTKVIWNEYDRELFGADKESVTALLNIEVPISSWLPEETPASVSTWLKEIEKQICFKYNTFVPFFYHGGKVWARFSYHMYNELEDYSYASKVTEKAFKDFFKNIQYYKKAPKSGSIFLVVEDLENLTI
ncbi:putative hercynylcysteine sulfoxide lyase [[Candida] railenensis]|uniref:Hercynylcysteine sulfoxide lyase n=1 Tax=[Candida] railenensis TaxID=45579 RepID=A0A9P0QM92_9ASCO|nr:putative hercynylcysteine sulfoxide lyase [[Candida] railenensis]